MEIPVNNVTQRAKLPNGEFAIRVNEGYFELKRYEGFSGLVLERTEAPGAHNYRGLQDEIVGQFEETISYSKNLEFYLNNRGKLITGFVGITAAAVAAIVTYKNKDKIKEKINSLKLHKSDENDPFRIFLNGLQEIESKLILLKNS